MKALAGCLSLILAVPVYAVYAVDPLYQEPGATWPVFVGLLILASALRFCVLTMRRIVNAGKEQGWSRPKG